MSVWDAFARATQLCWACLKSVWLNVQSIVFLFDFVYLFFTGNQESNRKTTQTYVWELSLVPSVGCFTGSGRALFGCSASGLRSQVWLGAVEHHLLREARFRGKPLGANPSGPSAVFFGFPHHKLEKTGGNQPKTWLPVGFPQELWSEEQPRLVVWASHPWIKKLGLGFGRRVLKASLPEKKRNKKTQKQKTLYDFI